MRAVAIILALAAGSNAFVAPSRSMRVGRMALNGVSAAEVKALREASGAGMMKCKEALMENDGNMEKAAEWLRAKGLASAGKKADRATKEGLIATYVHTGGKLGVMIELNCETDFVSKGEKFAELCKAVAMQVAASPTVDFVKSEDISDEVKEAERKAEMMSEDLQGKPEDIKVKMVEGRLGKILKQKVLLEQPYIRDPSMTVGDLIKGYISTLGENIQIARFVRFNLGETTKDEPEAVEEAAKTEAPAPEPPAPAPAPAPENSIKVKTAIAFLESTLSKDEIAECAKLLGEISV